MSKKARTRITKLAPIEAEGIFEWNWQQDWPVVGRPMAGTDLHAWRAKLKLTERDTCLVLGISRGALRRWERNGAPRYIALACTAILAKLPPYPQRRDPLSPL